MFTGIADGILKPLVLNKCDKKTQRQLAEIWSYGWMLHGVIFCRTQLRKHHKVLYNRGRTRLLAHSPLLCLGAAKCVRVYERARLCLLSAFVTKPPLFYLIRYKECL